MKKPTVKYLSALALAVGLGSMSMLAAPAEFGVQPHAQIGMITRYCLSIDPNACGFVKDNELMRQFARWLRLDQDRPRR